MRIFVGNERGIAEDTPPKLLWEDLTEDEKKLVELVKRVAPDNFMFRKIVFEMCHYYQVADQLLRYIERHDAVDIDSIMDWVDSLPSLPPSPEDLDDSLAEDEEYDDDWWSKPLPCPYPFLR